MSLAARVQACLALLALAALLAACSGPLLANPGPATRPLTPPEATPARAPDPQPVELPRDHGPHDRLTEWWYCTGHLVAEDGRPFGFELSRTSRPSHRDTQKSSPASACHRGHPRERRAS